MQGKGRERQWKYKAKAVSHVGDERAIDDGVKEKPEGPRLGVRVKPDSYRERDRDVDQQQADVQIPALPAFGERVERAALCAGKVLPVLVVCEHCRTATRLDPSVHLLDVAVEEDRRLTDCGQLPLEQRPEFRRPLVPPELWGGGGGGHGRGAKWSGFGEGR